MHTRRDRGNWQLATDAAMFNITADYLAPPWPAGLGASCFGSPVLQCILVHISNEYCQENNVQHAPLPCIPRAVGGVRGAQGHP